MSDKRAFTLIELLVVVAIIALLISILVPALAGAREQTKRVKCQANLGSIGQAVHLYLDDHGDVYPAARFYGVLGYIGRDMTYALLGSQIPEGQRPLNRYFGVENSPEPNMLQTQMRTNLPFQCPSDKGDAYLKLSGTFCLEHGTSYTYASDNSDDPPAYQVPLFGIESCRGLPLTLVKYPAKKIVFQEPVFNPSFDMHEAQAQWHHKTRNHANLLFSDGHVHFEFTRIFDWAADPNENEPYY